MLDLKRRARFEAKFTKGVGCWEWHGWRDGKGEYGMVRIKGRVIGAHRASYEMYVGPIPEGLTIDHLCVNPPCVRPDHLEPVTLRENLMRGTSPSAIRAAQTACVNGHAFDAVNTYVYKGWRQCRACNVARTQRYRKRKGGVA